MKPTTSMIQRIRRLFTPAAVLPIPATILLPILEPPNLYSIPASLLCLVVPPEWTALPFILLLLLPLLIRCNAERTSPDFIVLILIHYGDCMAHPNSVRWQPLHSIKNDVNRILRHVKYKHGDNTRKFYILTDFECEYTDFTGATRPLARFGLPTRDVILQTIQDAVKSGGSGLIYYGGHSLYIAPSTSEVKEQVSFSSSNQTGQCLKAGKEACLIASDGEQIYGNEISNCLSHSPAKRNGSTLTLVFDTCGAEGIAKDFSGLSYLYDVKSTPSQRKPSSAQPLRQLVLVTAARADESACAFNGFGALTFFMIKYLEDCSSRNQDPSAAGLVLYLNAECERLSRRQHPQIRSRYPLNRPFSLLPKEPRIHLRSLVQAPLAFHSWV